MNAALLSGLAIMGVKKAASGAAIGKESVRGKAVNSAMSRDRARVVPIRHRTNDNDGSGFRQLFLGFNLARLLSWNTLGP